MSAPPQGPGLALTNRKPWPSRMGEGQKSSYAVLIGSPTLVGSPHGSSGLSRRETQMSRLGCPLAATIDPGRFEARYRVRPSREAEGHPSFHSVLKAGSAPGEASSKLA